MKCCPFRSLILKYRGSFVFEVPISGWSFNVLKKSVVPHLGKPATKKYGRQLKGLKQAVTAY